MAHEVFDTILADAGFAGEYEALTETEIAGATVGAYSPGEDGVWKITASRTVQLLRYSPVYIQTFQTSAAILKVPSGLLPSASSASDALDGRFYFIFNDVTATGNITIQKSNGTTLGILAPNDFAIVIHGDSDVWSIFIPITTTNVGSTFLSTVTGNFIVDNNGNMVQKI